MHANEWLIALVQWVRRFTTDKTPHFEAMETKKPHKSSFIISEVKFYFEINPSSYTFVTCWLVL